MIQPPAIERFSPNHGPRPEPTRIDMLVLHYTGMTTAAAALERLCDPDARVSAHYVVEENGQKVVANILVNHFVEGRHQ